MSGLLLAAWIGLCAADAGTTHYGLASGAVREVTLSQSPWRNDAIVGAGAITVVWGTRKLAPNHPRTSRWVMVAAIAARSLTVINNVHQLRK